MSQGRRHFTDEFKREAVALLVSSGRPLSRIASELGISASMLRNWRNGSGGRDAGSARHTIPASAPHSALDPATEISRLRRENDRLRTERDILKKGCGGLLGTADMRFRLIEDHREIWPVRVMCAALSVSPSGYYAWRSRPDSPSRSQCWRRRSSYASVTGSWPAEPLPRLMANTESTKSSVCVSGLGWRLTI